ncbi:endochitinase PR4 [Cinnamomum micranthum f. kanehirae]|uniref:Endochitinase PR4 n=1 Tax=Cinnamomum micranthum f. kanehirae TaxID=337451 RepID=A0A443N805_9MAGN|nr:endochitinase PR4 [Cinnamomum micranthum f. kanehirae]
MGLDMARRIVAMALLLVCLCAEHSTGQSTPRGVVTQAYFNNLMSAVAASCEGKSFYTYASFIGPAELASGFGTTGSDVVRKREVAAFLANAMHETGAGRAIGFDGLKNPEIVAQNPTTSFRTAFWFWMNNDCHNAIVSGRGFGATIKAINSGECNGGNTGQVNSRISYYQRFCRDFAQSMGQTTPGTILTRAYFNKILANLPASCPGKGFYTYNGIIRAAQLSKGFGTTGSVTDRKRECYYGRGPLQITWNYNYGAAGKAIGQDLLNHPELVSTNPTISFQTAFWFWMTNCHVRLTKGGGFASTIRCINGGECRINRDELYTFGVMNLTVQWVQ